MARYGFDHELQFPLSTIVQPNRSGSWVANPLRGRADRTWDYSLSEAVGVLAPRLPALAPSAPARE